MIGDYLVQLTEHQRMWGSDEAYRVVARDIQDRATWRTLSARSKKTIIAALIGFASR